jgi:meiotically up-regulated gene 157 (Mug157) protein
MKLSTQYYNLTKDATPFKADWVSAMGVIVNIITEMQEGSDEEPSPPRYFFQRQTQQPTDTLMHGKGAPARRTGMSKSPFRPSDDASTFLFPIAANAMAVVSLRDLSSMLRSLNVAPELADKAQKLSAEISDAIYAHGIVNHPKYGKMFAYEVDGFGNAYLIDDANVPSLLSLPYLGFCSPSDPIYLNTRRFVLSTENPYYFTSSLGPLPGGIGGPHIGRGYIWPMSIIMRGLTSTSDDEIKDCLEMLKLTTGGTGFMHESFWKDDAGTFTRAWFAWANSLFGELILTVAQQRPHLIFRQ